ncbi:MAG: hypothetical protein KAG98_01270 [Lentisphaeria bacterium]|nr:hypothetical protein [Lentisphaeria bacterium]
MKKLSFTILLSLIVTLQLTTASVVQNALNFDGVNDHVNLHRTLPHLGGQQYYTLEAWINPDADGTGDRAIFGRSNGAVVGEFLLSLTTDNKINFSRATAPWGVNSTTIITPEVWTHVAAVYDGSFIKIYINGVFDIQLAMTGDSDNNPYDALIGSALTNHVSGRFFKGKIDNIRVWTVVRTEAQIASSMSIQLSDSEVGLASVWNFDHKSDSILSDFIGNSPGTLTNFATPDWVEGVTMTKLPELTASCFQLNSHFTPGEKFQQILGVKITATKTGNLTNLTFDLTGTTSLADIEKVHLYSTSNRNNFFKSIATEVMGIGINPTTSTVTFTGTTSLQLKENYYWLVLDLASHATVGNSIDASCTALTALGSIQTVSNQAPLGIANIESRIPKVVAYTLLTRIYQRTDAQLNETFDAITDALLIQMLSPNADGSLKIEDPDWKANLARLKTLRGTRKIRFLVGLAGHSKGPFADMCNNLEARKVFVTNLIKFVNDNGIDGIDIDWEYPQTGQEWESFNDLCRRLKHALYPTKGWLCSAGAHWNPHTNEVLSHMDYFNLMCYDDGGHHSTYANMVSQVNWYFTQRDIQSYRMVVGLPSYTNEVVDRDWVQQKGYNSVIGSHPNLPPYVDAIDAANGFAINAPYYNHGFNGVTTIQKKCEWIIANNCGGAMLFRLMTDMPTTHHKSVLRAAGQVINSASLDFTRTPANDSYTDATTLTFTFAENVTPLANKYVTIYNNDHSLFERISVTDTAKVTINGMTVTVEPATHFVNGRGYYALIDFGSFENAAGQISKSIYGHETWPFNIGAKPENALYFDGIGDYVNLRQTLPHLSGQQQYTIEAWINPDVGATGNRVIFSRLNGGQSAEYQIYLTGTNNVVFYREDGSVYSVGSATEITAGIWTHVAAVYDGAKIKIYINGVIDAERVMTRNASGCNYDVLIGANQTNGVPGAFFKGRIDTIRFWTVARTEAQILADHNKVLDSVSGLTAVWDFNENGGTILPDSNKTHTGTLVGLPTWTFGVGAKSATVGLELLQNGTELTWSFGNEIDGCKYQVINVDTGEVIATIIGNGSPLYQFSLADSVKVKLLVVDKYSTQTYFPIDGNIQTTQYVLKEGWNLVSITGDHVGLSPLLEVANGILWAWNGLNYEEKAQLKATDAVWVNVDGGVTVNVESEKSEATIVLTTGWSMVGPVNNNTIVMNDALSVFSYDQTYNDILADTNMLVRGVGYWIFSLSQE